MKSLRCFLILILLGLSSSAALADGIPDPGFGMGGGKTTTVLTSPTDLAFAIDYLFGTTTTAACGPPFTTHLACFSTNFINDTGKTFTSISFDITRQTPRLVFSCNNAGDPYFDTCNTTTDPITGHAVITFSGTTTHPGILPATSCTPGFEGGPPTVPCAGPTTTIGDTTINLYDFAVINDVSDAQTTGDFYHAQGMATVPEPPSVLLVLAGGMLLFLFKRSPGISVLQFGS